MADLNGNFLMKEILRLGGGLEELEFNWWTFCLIHLGFLYGMMHLDFLYGLA
jgi:hypothetical protein